MKIEELGLSVRPYNVLKRARIDTVEQLQQLSDDDLMRFRNMGRHSLEEIREKVEYVKTMTNADRIRAMSDEQLAAYWADHYDDFCQSKPECGDLLNDDKCIPDHWCVACALEWLRKPAEEPKLPAIFEDKQESGLLED